MNTFQSRLTKEFKELIYSKYNILGEFTLLRYDNNFEKLFNDINQCRIDKFTSNDKFVIVHDDTDYYMPNSEYGLSIYNLYKTFIRLDISLSTVLFITDHINIENDFNALIPLNQRKHNFPIIITNNLFVTRATGDIANYAIINQKNIDKSLILYHGVCMMGEPRIHRNIIFRFFKNANLLDKLICSYRNEKDITNDS